MAFCAAWFAVAGLHVILERQHLLWAAGRHHDRTGNQGAHSLGTVNHEEEKDLGPQGSLSLSPSLSFLFYDVLTYIEKLAGLQINLEQQGNGLIHTRFLL